MKRLLFIIALLLIAVPCMAASVTLEWEASLSSNVVGYAIFDKNFQKPYDYAAPIWEGTQLTCIVTVPGDRQTAFVARAYAWGVYDLNGNRTKEWSEDSNEVVATPTSVKPTPPRNLLIRLLQALLKIFNWKL